MLLSGLEIKKRVLDGRLGIEPFNEAQLNPNSYNLCLHDELVELTDLRLDMRKPSATRKVRIPDTGFLLNPGRLYLGRTVEYTTTPDLAPCLEGRSSVGRLGIQVHITAGFGDAGFCGYWTLEITCVLPVIIYPWVPICQIGYSTVLGEIESYAKKGKYHDSRDILASRMYQEF